MEFLFTLICRLDVPAALKHIPFIFFFIFLYLFFYFDSLLFCDMPRTNVCLTHHILFFLFFYLSLFCTY